MTAVSCSYLPAGQPSAALQRLGPDLFPYRRAGAKLGPGRKVAYRSKTVSDSSSLLAVPRFPRARLRAIRRRFRVALPRYSGLVRFATARRGPTLQPRPGVTEGIAGCGDRERGRRERR